MLGGSLPRSFRPLNDAIMSRRIRGVAAIVGCNNPRSQHDYLHTYVTRELLKQDVLVVETGCGAIASAKLGLLLGEAGLDQVGPGLREICETVGIPPVLHMGSCVDNSRILTVLTQMAGRRAGRRHRPGPGRRPRAGMDEREGAVHRHLLRGLRRVRHLRWLITRQRYARSRRDSDIVLESTSAKAGRSSTAARWNSSRPGRDDPATLEHIDKKRAALGMPAYDPELASVAAAMPACSNWKSCPWRNAGSHLRRAGQIGGEPHVSLHCHPRHSRCKRPGHRS
jgi:hypothetical protein